MQNAEYAESMRHDPSSPATKEKKEKKRSLQVHFSHFEGTLIM
jgi:hypothetical protein